MDVFISRWLEKTFDFTQIVAYNIAGKVNIFGVVALLGDFMAFPEDRRFWICGMYKYIPHFEDFFAIRMTKSVFTCNKAE